jgi:hypothetical protein
VGEYVFLPKVDHFLFLLMPCNRGGVVRDIQLVLDPSVQAFGLGQRNYLAALFLFFAFFVVLTLASFLVVVALRWSSSLVFAFVVVDLVFAKGVSTRRRRSLFSGFALGNAASGLVLQCGHVLVDFSFARDVQHPGVGLFGYTRGDIFRATLLFIVATMRHLSCSAGDLPCLLPSLVVSGGQSTRTSIMHTYP